MFKLISFTTFLLLFTSFPLLSQANQNDQQCLALVLQGGGDQGAYQAGALSTLVNETQSETTQYDVISGVAIGAMNAAWISQYPKGQETDMIQKLLDFWLNINGSDIYKNWPGGIVQGLLYEPSMYDVSPGVEYLKSHLTNISQRYVSVGATDIDNAVYKSFNNFDADVPVEDFIQQVMASFALPGLFPYVVINNTAYFDGGAIMSVDVTSAVLKCREITGGNDNNIIVDIILLTSSTFKGSDASHAHGLQMIIRTLELMAFNSAMNGLVQAQNSFPNVTYRYLIQPSQALPDSDLPIHFTHDDIVKMINLGEQDALAAIKRGPGVDFKDYLKEARERLGRKSNQTSSEDFMGEYRKEFEHFVRDQLKAKSFEKKVVSA